MDPIAVCMGLLALALGLYALATAIREGRRIDALRRRLAQDDGCPHCYAARRIGGGAWRSHVDRTG